MGCRRNIIGWYYGHDRRVQDGHVRYRHDRDGDTPTKLLALTNPNANPNADPNPNPNSKP